MNLTVREKYHSVLQKLIWLDLIVIAFSLALFRWIVPPFIVLLAVLWIFLLVGRGLSMPSKVNFLLICVFATFYGLHVISALISDDRSSGFFDLEVKAGILVLPVLMLFLPPMSRKKISGVLHAFILGNLFAALICIVLAFYNSFGVVDGAAVFQAAAGDKQLGFFTSITQGGNYFFYEHLSYFRHPGYFAMYLIFALVAVLEILRKQFQRFVPCWLLYSCIAVFVIMTVLLLSRAGIVTAFFVFGLYLALIVFKRISRLQFAGIALLFAGLFALLVLINPRFNEVVSSVFKKKEAASMHYDSQGSRAVIWGTALEVIADNWLTGVGTGDIHDELNTRYALSGDERSRQQNLNVHNQFLETFATVGIAGLLNLLLVLILLFAAALKRKDMLLKSLVIIFFVAAMFESILNTQSGVVFFMFSFCLLLMHHTAVDGRQQS